MWIIGVLVLALVFGMAMRRKERGLPFVGPPRRIDVLGMVLGGGALGAEIYLVENTKRVNVGTWQWISIALLLMGFLGGGLVIGQWWATLFLTLLAILFSIPTGENHAIPGDIPWVSFTFVFLLPVWIALVALGVVIHKLALRFWPRRREPRLA